MGDWAIRYRRAINPYRPIASGLSCRSAISRCGIGLYADGSSNGSRGAAMTGADGADVAENMGTSPHAALTRREQVLTAPCARAIVRTAAHRHFQWSGGAA